MRLYNTFLLTVLAFFVMNFLFCYVVMNLLFHCRGLGIGCDETATSLAKVLELWPAMHFSDRTLTQRTIYRRKTVRTASVMEHSNDDVVPIIDQNLLDLKTIDENTSELLYKSSLLESDRILFPPPCDDDIYLLVIVVSAPGHFRHRAEMRTAMVTQYRGRKCRLVFVTARPADPNTDAILWIENLIHNDIIQARHWDAYRRMTYTALESLNWALTECGHTKYLLKIDDDVLVIYEHIIDYMIGLEETNATLVYAGLHNENEFPSRNVFSKWYLSYEDYKHDTLPPFVCGFAVLFSQDALRAIYRASFHVSRVFDIPRREFPLDDAFIGICAKYAKIKLTKILWMCYEWRHVEAAVREDRCVMVKLKAVHGIPGYKEIHIYLEQLKSMTAEERDACHKKNTSLPERCFE